MRARREQSTGSMDSLLDTMTNVVGILVILLVVTQLGVSSAVKRIRSNLPEVSIEEFKLAQKETSQNLEKVNALENQWKGLEENSRKDITDLASLKKELAVFKGKGPASAVSNLDAIRTSISKAEKEERDLKSILADLESEIAKISKEIDETSRSAIESARIIRIPDPRPAPPNARGEWFVCKKGLITYADTEKAASTAGSRISFLKSQLYHGTARLSQGGLKQWKGATKPSDGKTESFEYDRQKIEDYFKKNPVNVMGHAVSVYGREDNASCWVSMNVSMSQGEKTEALDSPLSKYRQTLKKIKEKNNYARFLVYPDSFEVYLKAREISEREDIPGGWTLTTSENWNTWHSIPDIKVHITKPRPPDPEKKPASKPSNVLD